MKTRHPFILTARIAEADRQPFDRLRQAHFPPARNFLRAHLTMFHRLPGEYLDRMSACLTKVVAERCAFAADVCGLRHLGAGVAFALESPDLQAVRAELRAAFGPWLGPQDMQTWQPHITVQNKVSRSAADSLHRDLAATFEPHPIRIVGLDLWEYLNGPWRHERTALFADTPQS
ncbi:2'-5' RNA ligase family protein [Rhizobium halophytocola]|uniref:2'-5' RNA ligase family protein n=1 Tax=Rhizobium halophytocola TaxID=735519 RepID=A0ABS4E221_9HYPH|nr:2'-5' RNA ligase family protein [Rhizobium halophytocola]MBP1851996.1 hypothetical protein [Rhizobium halophytocola]